MGKFERVKYPDGQISAKWTGTSTLGSHPNTVIKERINSYEDLMYVRAIADIIQNMGENKFTLFIPCMFGQRSDRRFEFMQSFDLKLICDIINSCNFKEVQVFDPHSDVTLALLNRSRKVTSYGWVADAVSEIVDRPDLSAGDRDNLLLVSPDAGAYKKVFEYGQSLKIPVMGAMKHRDSKGNIQLMFTHDVEGKDCLIVDDLCDGGFTFISLAQQLKEHKARKVYLYVSHGIFSKGFGPLMEHIDYVFTSNSVKDVNYDEIIKTGDMVSTTKVRDFVTQYKIV